MRFDQVAAAHKDAFQIHRYAPLYFQTVEAFVDEMASMDSSDSKENLDWLCGAFLRDNGEDGKCQGGAIEMDPQEVSRMLSERSDDLDPTETITQFVARRRAEAQAHGE